MASNLRKYKYTGKAATRKPGADTPSNMSEPAEQTEMEMKAEILSSLKMEIASLFQTELKGALAAEFGVIKSELQAVKTEIANNTAVLDSDLETIKTTVSDMEQGSIQIFEEVKYLYTEHGWKNWLLLPSLCLKVDQRESENG